MHIWQNPKGNQFTVMQNREKQQMLTLVELEPGNMFHFARHLSIIKVVDDRLIDQYI